MPIPMPPLPSGLRTLRDPDFERLRSQYPGLWLDPNKACLTCNKTGVARTREGDKIVEYECDCLAQWTIHIMLLHSGIGLAYQRLSWADLDSQVPAGVEEKVYQYHLAADQMMNAGLGLIFHGDHGTGKTLLATLLAKKMIGMGYDCYFTQFNEMIDSYTKGWRNDDEHAWFIRRVRNTDFLVVDDIGRYSQGRDNTIVPMFDQVIRARVANAKPTIITTNWSAEELERGTGGPGVMGLLTEQCEMVHVPGDNFRLKARDRNLADAKEGLVRPLVLG